MAEVWVAQSVSVAGFKKKVAIKRILPGLLKDDRFVRMFLDEARLSLHFNHANVVSVFDLGKSDETYFIVMEYVQGTTLKRLLEHLQERGRRISLPLVIWILNETLKGLDYAHALTDPETNEHLGVVHRDISPPNLLISWNGEVKLTDFGLAKATSQLESTDPGVVKGKFSYLSPEAAHGKAVDGRTDLFAVGILAYEMLTMKRLFLGETDYQTVELVRAAEIPSIRAQNPDVPAELEQIILKSLARDENQRYQSAAEFADDLLSFLFSHRLKVSARDLSATMAELRQIEEAKVQRERAVGGPANLIMQLMAEELANFRSIDEDSDAGDQRTGAHSLIDDEDFGNFDSSAPLVEGLDDLIGPDPGAGGSPKSPPKQAKAPKQAPKQGPPKQAPPKQTKPTAPEDLPDPGDDLPGITENSIAHTRLPSPAPRESQSNTGVWILVALVVLLGGGAAVYFLVIAPGMG
ncbi:protein kinase [Pseudenhygromyxa sp. WMMC2535]|nr:protein kinase [Pseudenhygromyxa sp. WMMC2535]